jgi:hypothetical protein
MRPLPPPPRLEGTDLELGKLHEHVAEVDDNCDVEGKQLSRSTMEISNALVDLNVLPIQGIPSQPRSVQDVMEAFSLVLERICGRCQLVSLKLSLSGTFTASSHPACFSFSLNN